MPLSLHLSIHVFLALLAGFIVWRIWKKPLISFFFALVSGVAVDFDHFIDYFLAFGWNFRLDYFKEGYQFLKSDKLYIFAHGWEYAIILVILVFLTRNYAWKSLCLGLALGLFFHLSADVLIDQMPIISYSILYRAKNNFALEKLVYPEHWAHHQALKRNVNFD